MRKEVICTLLLLGLIVAAMSAVAFAQAVTVTIGYPSNPGDLGITSGSYWIGQFPVTITNGATVSSGEAYCENYLGTLYEGHTYSANIVAVPDTATWRAVSYILSWYAPTDNNGAAIDQVAIWSLLDNYNPSYFSLPSSITTAAANLAGIASGKDVARQGDQLTWISPSTGSISANPGQTVTFRVQLTAPRQSVQIDFSAILQPPSGPSQTLSSTYVNSMQAFTDSSGIAQVSVTVPSDAPLGSTIQVQASTQYVWPQKYLDLTSSDSSLQNIIGIGPALDLTVSCHIYVLGYIMVVPESAYGALSALVAFAAAFIIYSKLKLLTKQTNP